MTAVSARQDNNQPQKVLFNREKKHLDKLSTVEFFDYVLSFKCITITSLYNSTDLSMTTLKKFRRRDLEYLPTADTLRTLCLDGFHFSYEEAEYFCARYEYTFKNSKFRKSVEFKKKLKKKEKVFTENRIYYPKPQRQAIIKEKINSGNALTQESLALLLNVSRETIARDFKELKIHNIGSKKKPKWEIEE